MQTQRVYLLQQVLDDPGFEGFGFVSRPRSLLGNRLLEDDFSADVDGAVPLLEPHWQSPRVRGRVRSTNDFPCVDLTIPAFSRRAVDALGSILKENGELLPLTTDRGEYFAYHVTTVVDALDQDLSDINWFTEPPPRILFVNRYVFREQAIANCTVFTVPQQRGSAFVTEGFLAAVQTAKLEGFRCPLLWPLPPGTNWMVEDKRAREHGT